MQSGMQETTGINIVRKILRKNKSRTHTLHSSVITLKSHFITQFLDLDSEGWISIHLYLWIHQAFTCERNKCHPLKKNQYTTCTASVVVNMSAS